MIVRNQKSKIKNQKSEIKLYHHPSPGTSP